MQRVFEHFCQSLIPDDFEREKAAGNKEAILARLRADFGTTELLASGSFGHGTNIRGFSDIDYFAVTPNGSLRANSKYALQDFRNSLLRRFPATDIGVRTPAVSVRFSSRDLIQHEIIPCWHISTEKGVRIFGMPDGESGWMLSTPSAHNNWVSSHNARLDSNLKKLIRLLKAWKYINGASVKSFYLEMRATEYSMKERAIVYSIDLLEVFKKLREVRLAAMNDPIGFGARISACSEAQKLTELARIEVAIATAERARSYESIGNVTEAYKLWDRVFGSRLPLVR